MPSRRLLYGLLLLAALPPFVARALGSGPFAFAMFTRVERYHLEVHAELPGRSRRLSLSELEPHLSRDARRVVLPAEGYGFGQEQVQLLAHALPDIARLVCELEPTASRVLLRLFRAPVTPDNLRASSRAPAPSMPHQDVAIACHAQ